MSVWIGLILVGGPAALLAWLAYAVPRDRAKQIRALAQLPCPTCGVSFGAEAAAQADQQHRDDAESARRNNPGMFIHLSHRWPVRCAACGATLRFDPRTLALTHGL